MSIQMIHLLNPIIFLALFQPIKNIEILIRVSDFFEFGYSLARMNCNRWIFCMYYHTTTFLPYSDEVRFICTRYRYILVSLTNIWIPASSVLWFFALTFFWSELAVRFWRWLMYLFHWTLSDMSFDYALKVCWFLSPTTALIWNL